MNLLGTLTAGTAFVSAMRNVFTVSAASRTNHLRVRSDLENASSLSTIANSAELSQAFVANVVSEVQNGDGKRFSWDMRDGLPTGLEASADKVDQANFVLLAEDLFAALNAHTLDANVEITLPSAGRLNEIPIQDIATSAKTHNIGCEWLYSADHWNDNATQRGELAYIGNELLSAGWSVEDIEANLVIVNSAYCSEGTVVKSMASDMVSELSRLRNEGKINIHPAYIEFQISDGPNAGIWCPAQEGLIEHARVLADQGITIVRHDGNITIHLSRHGLNLDLLSESLRNDYLAAYELLSDQESNGNSKHHPGQDLSRAEIAGIVVAVAIGALCTYGVGLWVWARARDGRLCAGGNNDVGELAPVRTVATYRVVNDSSVEMVPEVMVVVDCDPEAQNMAPTSALTSALTSDSLEKQET